MKKIDIDRAWQRVYDDLRDAGGQGSGNYGHAGRPGEVGGSAPGFVDPRTRPVLVFHGTSDQALASIKQKGLTRFGHEFSGADEYARQQGAGMGGRPASIYLTTSGQDARTYAKYAAEVTDGQPVMLQIEVPREAWNTHVKSAGDAADSSYRIEQDIPPDWIKGVTEVGGLYSVPEWRPLAEGDTRPLYAVFVVRPIPKTAGGEGSGNFGHKGRPGEVGGSAPGDGTPSNNDAFDQWYIDHAKPVTERVATAMGLDPNMIHLVAKEMPKFTVGDKLFSEAGHFDPATGQVEINVRSIPPQTETGTYTDLTPSQVKAVEEITTHELMHAVYDASEKARRAESDAENELFKQPSLVKPPGDVHPDTGYYQHDRWGDLFYMSGEVKPGMENTVRQLFPVSSIWAYNASGWGSSFRFTPKGNQPNNTTAAEWDATREQFVKDDGVSPYSKSYWTPEALRGNYSYDRAFNETLAEVSRIQANGLRKDDTSPTRSWSNLAQGLRLWYRSTHPVTAATPKTAAAGPGSPDHVAYFDAELNYQPTPDGAAWAKAIWDNGKRVFYRIEPVAPRTAGSSTSGNYGHAGRPGQVGGSAPQGDEGYAWFERPEMEAYVKTVPYAESQAITDYASFGYGDINRLLRGSFTPNEILQEVRPATPEEVAAFKDFQITSDYIDQYGHPIGRSDVPKSPDDPRGRVVDEQGNYLGHVMHVPYTSYDDPANFKVERRVPDQAYVQELHTKIDTINTAIREHGYTLTQPMEVNRAAYVPGMTYDGLKAMEGDVFTEQGFTSTMLGNPSNRLNGYVVIGKSESLSKRYKGEIYANQNEVGTAMRVKIVLPEGMKVAPVEALRRTDYEFPRIQDPAAFNHPEWLKNADGTPNGLKVTDFTMRDYTATPTIKTDRLHDNSQRSEAEILLGSGAQFRVKSVKPGGEIGSSDPKMRPTKVVDVEMEYVGGGSSDGSPQSRGLAAATSKGVPGDVSKFVWNAFNLSTGRFAGGAHSGNYGHAGRPGHLGGSAPGQSEKVRAALLNYKPFSLAKDQAAAAAETEVVKLTGGVSTRDNDPVDVVVTRGGKTYGFEVKTLLDNTADKITVRGDALARKEAWAREHHASLHTLVIDQRDTFGKGQGYSGHRLWYKRGVGSFRLGAMIPIESAAHLKRLMR